MVDDVLPLNKILLGDNIELFKQIPNDSIDLIFADPPYNMNLQKDLIRYDGSKFDGVDDEWDKYESLEEYDKECKLWLAECLRVLKKDGSLWVIGSFQNIHRLRYILQDMGAWIINEIVWEKSNPVPNFGGTRFVNAQETMLWVTKNSKAKFTFNYKTMKHINGGTQMKSVWKLPICTGSERLKDESGKKFIQHKNHSHY
ncbi:DNA-methyltransferase [Metamycoplasma hyosynoviae]|uniref:DNA-methyltransferase n=1 Tax=Metamycoplasma hyosynoviae TaxID=29559 RepID=UPI00068BD83E|nr:site-specific DNA-methyltransferase [Metamycoplasma hyosynoviae]